MKYKPFNRRSMNGICDAMNLDMMKFKVKKTYDLEKQEFLFDALEWANKNSKRYRIRLDSDTGLFFVERKKRFWFF